MQVILAALGGGTMETVTTECAAALRQADCVLGAQRLLARLPEDCCANRIAATRPAELLDAILQQEGDCVVVYSGDTGFYSGARSLLPMLQEKEIPAKVLPGISSMQILSARLGRPWQEWTLVSAHGVDCNVVSAVLHARPAFFLTGGTWDAQKICARLAQAGLGALSVTVGENLSYENERLITGTAADLAQREFAPLSVLLSEAAPRISRRSTGFSDDAFQRGNVPMTKQEVRAAALAKLAVGPKDILWDVGAGTGSVSVELALAAPEGETYAVECAPEACALLRANREQFCAWNLQIVEGCAPAALLPLPAPDAVFVGGTRGEMETVIDLILEKNSNARICAAAIALETLTAAVAALTKRGLEARVTQIAVSRTKAAGPLHLLIANNPVFLITGNCDA